MELSSIEKNKLENIDLLQIEYLSDLPVSKTKIMLIEGNSPVAITFHKLLTTMGFENIYVCEQASDAIKIFSDFNNQDVSMPIIISENLYQENIVNVIKELFAIQPSAKIIVSTAKEKNHPEIIRLFNLGISAIISKSPNLDSLMNTLALLEEKNDTDTSTQNNLELLMSSSRRLSFNQILAFLKADASVVMDHVENAIKSGMLAKDGDVIEATCNQCKSPNLCYVSVCFNCQGTNFQQKILVEHFKCGAVYPTETSSTMCQKCNQDLGLIGRDYSESSEYFFCNSCGGKFPKPLSRFSCTTCGNLFLKKLALWEKSNLYKVLK